MSPTALEHERSHGEQPSDFLHREREVHIPRTGDDIGHPPGAEEGEVLVAHTLGEDCDDMIASNVIGLPSEPTARIHGECEARIVSGCAVVGTGNVAGPVPCDVSL
ncbi:MAG: hypothetical protein LC721_03985 [Actinobacteria bacterium]|nr:hypothetical protein [Actinomycetota bacterium]